MPMNFPDMDSLKSTAKVHKFRQPNKSETEKDSRTALAEYMKPQDRIESFEILFGVGWDQWTNDQKLQSLFP